jgi:tRNA(Ile)-lysidine synthase
MFLRRVKKETGSVAIALAHTRDDQAETLLIRLLRGAGRQGLAAMRLRTGDLLRPLLGVCRQAVLDHLHARGLAWREDPTNADLSITRNRIRHELIPYLERHFNPGLRETLARSAAVLAEEADVLASVSADVTRARGRSEGTVYVLSRAGLAATPRAVARLSVRRALQETGGLRSVGLGHVDRVLDLAGRDDASGRRVPLPGGREALVHFDEVRVGPATSTLAARFRVPLSVPGRVELPDGRALEARPARGRTTSDEASAVVDAPEGPLFVRTRQPGDRVRTKGREMSLKRFLMDRRIPAAQRGSLPLVAAGHRVLWVAGQRLEVAGPREGRLVRLELKPSNKERGA